MNAIVAGGRNDYVMTRQDFRFLTTVVRALGVKTIFTDGTAGVAEQVEIWARRRGISVQRVTANFMHDGPATLPERNASLVLLAKVLIAFPGDGHTDDLMTKARKRRCVVLESPGRQIVPEERPEASFRITPPQQGQKFSP